MKSIALVILLFLGTAGIGYAQDFITRGKIEFEIKKNTRRLFDEEQRRNSIEPIPDEDIAYRDLIFSGNQSIYTPGRIPPRPSMFPVAGEVYMDLYKKETIIKSRVVEDEYVFGDSLKKVKWKIQNDTRKIAGWECRKAVGVIDDSIYVVAFYCPEIITQGGPELFSGLPGMILGLAIPRFYTTWFATRIELANVDETKIVAPSIKKSKQYTKKELAELIYKKYKDVSWWKDMSIDKVTKWISGYTIN